MLARLHPADFYSILRLLLMYPSPATQDAAALAQGTLPTLPLHDRVAQGLRQLLVREAPAEVAQLMEGTLPTFDALVAASEKARALQLARRQALETSLAEMDYVVRYVAKAGCVSIQLPRPPQTDAHPPSHATQARTLAGKAARLRGHVRAGFGEAQAAHGDVAAAHEAPSAAKSSLLGSHIKLLNSNLVALQR